MDESRQAIMFWNTASTHWRLKTSNFLIRKGQMEDCLKKLGKYHFIWKAFLKPSLLYIIIIDIHTINTPNIWDETKLFPKLDTYTFELDRARYSAQ